MHVLRLYYSDAPLQKSKKAGKLESYNFAIGIGIGIGLDIGFGWTKYVVGSEQVKFPTWIGLWTGYAVSDVRPIKYEGREYVVSYPARFSKQRIEVVSLEDLVRWSGLIV